MGPVLGRSRDWVLDPWWFCHIDTPDHGWQDGKVRARDQASLPSCYYWALKVSFCFLPGWRSIQMTVPDQGAEFVVGNFTYG